MEELAVDVKNLCLLTTGGLGDKGDARRSPSRSTSVFEICIAWHKECLARLSMEGKY